MVILCASVDVLSSVEDIVVALTSVNVESVAAVVIADWLLTVPLPGCWVVTTLDSVEEVVDGGA